MHKMMGWGQAGQMFQAEAKAHKAKALGSVKRCADTAHLLASLMPAGGRASRMRRTVSHLLEITLYGGLD